MSNTNVNPSLSVSAVLLLVLWAVPLTGAPPVQATVCAILQKPSAFNGKLVQVKGTVKRGFENFSLAGGGCGAIWVDFADDRYVNPRPKFKLVRDANFVEFERLVKASSAAEVILLGRLDGVDAVKDDDARKRSTEAQRRHRFCRRWLGLGWIWPHGRVQGAFSAEAGVDRQPDSDATNPVTVANRP